MVTYTPQTIPLSDLFIDPNNFRFKNPTKPADVPENRFTDSSVQLGAMDRIIKDGIEELKNSIKKNGFVPVERIVVHELPQAGTSDDEDAESSVKYIVIEGNRRTTALKALQDDNDKGAPLDHELIETFKNVPVLLAQDAEPGDLLAIMGIRHVGGPKEWGGYQSALLVYRLRTDDALNARETASKLGLETQEVNRRYKSFCALKQMMDNEDYSDLVTPELYPIFQEAFSRTSVKNWLSWDEAKLKFTNTEELEYFYDWVTSPKGGPKIAGYAAVRHLGKIVENTEALAALKEDGSIEESLAIVDSEAKARRWRPNASAALKSLKDMSSEIILGLDPQEREILSSLRSQAKFILDARAAAEVSNGESDDE